MANVQLRTSSWVFSPPTTTLTWVMILFKVATVVSILCPFQFTYIWFHCLFLATFWAKLMAPVQYIGRGETHMSPATAFQTMLLLPPSWRKLTFTWAPKSSILSFHHSRFSQMGLRLQFIVSPNLGWHTSGSPSDLITGLPSWRRRKGQAHVEAHRADSSKINSHQNVLTSLPSTLCIFEVGEKLKSHQTGSAYLLTSVYIVVWHSLWHRTSIVSCLDLVTTRDNPLGFGSYLASDSDQHLSTPLTT